MVYWLGYDWWGIGLGVYFYVVGMWWWNVKYFVIYWNVLGDRVLFVDDYEVFGDV